MTKLSVERIQILDLQSWLYYLVLIQQIFIKYLPTVKHFFKCWRDRDGQDKDSTLRNLRGVEKPFTLELLSEL